MAGPPAPPPPHKYETPPPAPGRVLLSGHNVFAGSFLKNHSTSAKMGEGVPPLGSLGLWGGRGEGGPAYAKREPPLGSKKGKPVRPVLSARVFPVYSVILRNRPGAPVYGLPAALPSSKAFALTATVFGGTSFLTASSRDSAFKGIDHEAAPRITTFCARALPASTAI